MSQSDNSTIRFNEKLGYGLGAGAINAFWQLFATFLTFFYTDIFGLAAGAMATMFLVSRIWDAVNDPLLGALADRTNTKWGKFRPYILWGAIPFGIFGFLTFLTPNWDDQQKLIYAYVTYIGVGMAYTAVNIPFTSLIGVSSQNSIARTGVSSFQFVGAFVGVLIVQLCTLDLVKLLGGDNPQKGYMLTAAIYSTVAVLALWYAFAVTRERVVEPKKSKHGNVAKEFSVLFRTGPWLLLGLACLGIVFYASVRGASTIYYLKYFVDREDLIKWYLAIGSVACIVGTPLMRPLSAKLGKRNLFMGMMVFAAITTAVHYFVKPDQIVLLFVLNFFVGLFSGPIFALIYSMFADVADYIDWKHRIRMTGLVFSAGSFAFKFGWTGAGYVAGITLAYYGYEANVEQSTDSIKGILLLMSVIPSAAAVLTIIGLALYPLTNKRMSEIESDLNERKSAEAEGA